MSDDLAAALRQLPSVDSNASGWAAPAAFGLRLLPVPHLGAVDVVGPDAATFLGNLLTCQLAIDAPVLGALCNAKGRMISLHQVLCLGPQRYRLLLPKQLTASVCQQLLTYVFRSKVQVRNCGEETLQIGFAGDNLEAVLQDLVGQGVGESGLGVRDESMLAARMVGAPTRYLCSGPSEVLGAWGNRLGADTLRGSGWEWRLAEIRAGVASVWEKTTQAFIPQWANLDLVGGLSFNKGCYPGQEIVARMHYLGKPTRRMFRIEFAGLAQAGDALLDPASDTKVGTIVDSCPVDSQISEALAIIQLDRLDAPLVVQEDRRAIRLLELPYDPLEGARAGSPSQ